MIKTFKVAVLFAMVIGLMSGFAVVEQSHAADHLLISEVVVQTRPPANVFGTEFVEIHNPTGSDIDLSNIYMTDATSSTSGSWYWDITEGGGGGGIGGDFHCKFPIGTILPAGDKLIIAINGSTEFNTAYATNPDFELFEDSTVDAVPEMVEVFPGSIGFGLGSNGSNIAGSEGFLATSAETIVLYSWDGVSATVQDIDYFIWGTTNVSRADKTGVAGYLPDTSVSLQVPVANEAHTFGVSFARTDNDETGETLTGGNGITGNNETSEPLVSTWETSVSQTPEYSTLTYLPAPIVTNMEVPAMVFGGYTAAMTATISAFDTIDTAVFSYRVNEGSWTEASGSDNGDDTWTGNTTILADFDEVDWFVTVTSVAGAVMTKPVTAPAYFNSFTVMEMPDPGDAPPHLLLTEICVQGSPNEFIEIYNPTDETVELDNFYLTDAVYNDQGYWRLPEGSPAQNTIGGGEYNDFHAKFPDGSSIEPGHVLTVSIAGATAFAEAWGTDPDFELYEEGSPDAIPDLSPVFPGSNDPSGTGDLPSLTNGAEIVVLYYWDGITPLVTDIDMFMWGSSTSARVDKTGYSAYLPDTPIAEQDQFMTAHNFGETFIRLDTSEGSEIQFGGNGSAGDDETSENISTTWQTGVGTPGVFETQELTIAAVSLSPSHPGPDAEVIATATIVSLVDVSSVTLSWSLDASTYTDVDCTDNGDGTWNGTIPGQPLDTVVSWFVTAAGGGYTAGWPVSSYTVEDPPEPGEGLAKLLLTEICVQGTEGEFIEVYNPNDFEVPLDNYYLTDGVYYDQGYWMLGAGNPSQGTVGGGDFTDFNARFPADAVIAAGDTISISIAGSNAYTGTYGFAPHYELFEDGQYGDNIDDFRDVFEGSINGASTPTLTNGGEIVVLYYWDGISDLTVDIDAFIWGEAGGAHHMDKSGVNVGGSTYNNEAGFPELFSDIHSYNESFTRADALEGTEIQTGGNGFEGADETSENLATTWTIAMADPVRVPMPEGAGKVTLTITPAPFLPRLGETIPVIFTASSNAETIVRIFDMEGRVVRTMFDSRFDGAASVVEEDPTRRDWDGRNDRYEIMPAGMYIVHLSVVDKFDGEQTTLTVPAVVATRLGG